MHKTALVLSVVAWALYAIWLDAISFRSMSEPDQAVAVVGNFEKGPECCLAGDDEDDACLQLAAFDCVSPPDKPDCSKSQPSQFACPGDASCEPSKKEDDTCELDTEEKNEHICEFEGATVPLGCTGGAVRCFTLQNLSGETCDVKVCKMDTDECFCHFLEEFLNENMPPEQRELLFALCEELEDRLEDQLPPPGR